MKNIYELKKLKVYDFTRQLGSAKLGSGLSSYHVGLHELADWKVSLKF